MLSLMGRNAFCCQRFCDDVLHLSAADVVRLCQNEMTAESITLAAILFELFCIRDGSYSIEFEVLLLTILTVSVGIDVLYVLDV